MPARRHGTQSACVLRIVTFTLIPVDRAKRVSCLSTPGLPIQGDHPYPFRLLSNGKGVTLILTSYFFLFDCVPYLALAVLSHRCRLDFEWSFLHASRAFFNF